MNITPEQLAVHLDLHALQVTPYTLECGCGDWIRRRSSNAGTNHRTHIVDTLFSSERGDA